MLEPAEVEKRKNLVYFALKSFLQNEDLSKAMDIWDKEFSNTESLSLNGFLNKISFISNINGNRTNVLVALTKTLADPNNAKLGIGFETNKTTTPNSDQSMIIFEYLITKLSSLLSENDKNIRNKLAQQISPNLNKLDLNSNQKNRIIEFIAGNVDSTAIKIAMEEQKEIIHLLYAYSCELVGPVGTDKIMSRVIQSAESLPEAKVISPKFWL